MSKKRLDSEPFKDSMEGHGDTRRIKKEQEISEEWVRCTFIVKKNYKDQLQAESYWDRKTIKDVLNEILENHYKDKDFEPIPKKK